MILTAFLTSCNNEESELPVAIHEIQFTGVSLPASRTGDPLPTHYQMWVAAIYHNQTNTEHQYYFPSPYETLFTCESNTGIWKCPTLNLLYPFSGTMDFLTYAIENSAHKPNVTYSPSILSEPSNTTFSEMVLDFGEKLDGTDAVVFSDRIDGAGCGSAASVQHLQFRNALAKVVFNLRTADAATSQYFKISSFTVKGLKTSGILKVTASPTFIINDQEFGSEAAWQLPLSGSTKDINIMSGVSPINPALVPDLQSAGSAIGTPLYLPTQDTSPKDVNVDLEYSIINKNNATVGPHKISLTLSNTNWLPGNQYNYIITCSLTEITVACSSTGAVVDSNPVNIPIDEIYNGNTPL